MDSFLLRMFQRQVLLQCEFMLFAFEDINEAFEGGRSREEKRSRAFYGIQNFLNAAANVSKALWGQGGRLADQRKPLRDSIGVSDDSPFREVTMRNNFEHFDERIDVWWAESSRRVFIDGSTEGIWFPPGATDIDVFRNFSRYSMKLLFWGQEFDLLSLIEEVRRILPTLRAKEKPPP